MAGAARAIHHLNCGTMCPRGELLMRGEGSLLGEARVVAHCLLIEGADGLVLVDTGFGIDDIRDPGRIPRFFRTAFRPRLDLDETAHAQVRALGFDPGDVRQIVATHLDLDHSGGLPDFPAAEVHLLGRERAAAMNPNLLERQRYLASHWSHQPHWVEHEPGGDEWLGFASIRILPGSEAEILLIPLPGHTLGHTGVAIRHGDGWLLHCGDAYFHHGEVQTPPHCPPAIRAVQNLNQTDGRARRENQERLRELARRHGGEVQLICSHDPYATELESEPLPEPVPAPA